MLVLPGLDVAERLLFWPEREDDELALALALAFRAELPPVLLDLPAPFDGAVLGGRDSGRRVTRSYISSWPSSAVHCQPPRGFGTTGEYWEMSRRTAGSNPATTGRRPTSVAAAASPCDSAERTLVAYELCNGHAGGSHVEDEHFLVVYPEACQHVPI